MSQTSKRMEKAYEGIDREKEYALEDAVKMLKGVHKTNMDETVELAINLNLDTRKSDQTLRGVTQLPHGTGKTLRIAVFARGEQAEAAKKAGADIIGAEDLAEKIEKGEMNFDRCIASPDMMGVVGKVAKILGPRGLMPNPKTGTVTPNVTEAIEAAKAGQVEFRAEKQGIVHAGVGKIKMDEKKLTENLAAFIDAVVKAKPSGVKGSYVKKISLTSTMGPSLRVALPS